jgi:hypothetical protein
MLNQVFKRLAVAVPCQRRTVSPLRIRAAQHRGEDGIAAQFVVVDQTSCRSVMPKIR